MIILDWSRHPIGPKQPCTLCGRPAICRNPDGQPCHKVCAEAEAELAGEAEAELAGEAAT